VVQNQPRQLPEKRRHSIRMPKGDQAQRMSGRFLSGRTSKVNAQLAICDQIAIIAPQMTGKTLVCTTSRPLLHHSLLMAFGLVSLLLSTPAGAEVLEVTEVIAHPQHYDRKEVVVMGQVTGVQPVTDKQGQPAFQFLLKDNAGTLKVISRVPVQEGGQVIVEGTFTRRRQGGRLAVYNEVSAIVIRPLNQFFADLVG
jgi:hypothetical protein